MTWQAARSAHLIGANSPTSSFRRRCRGGIILVLSTFIMVIVFAMAAFAVDLGYIVLTQAELQNAADAATLASVVELTDEAYETNAEAKQGAIDEAKKVALMNVAAGRPVTLYDGDIDIGTRIKNASGYEETWGGEGPYNAVRTTPRRDANNPDAPDGRLELFFADVMYHLNGEDAYLASLNATSRAHLSPRDLVYVIDRSGSMNHDTEWGMGAGRSETEAIAKAMFGGNPIWNGGEQKHWSSTKSTPPYQDVYNWALNKKMFDKSKNGTNLTQTQFFDQEFPADELPSSAGSNQHWRHWKWHSFLDYQWGVWDNNNSASLYHQDGNYRNRNLDDLYGRLSIRLYISYLALNGYLPAFKGQRFHYPNEGSSYSNKKLFPLPIPSGDYVNHPFVPSQPINIVRNASLEGIGEMESGNAGSATTDFYDQLGYVSYGTIAKKDFLLMRDLTDLEIAAANIVGGARGGNGNTNVEMGIRYGRDVLLNSPNSRLFATKVLIVLSDGIANRYGNNGNSGTSTAKSKCYEAAQMCADSGIFIHTIALGDDADLTLMQNIADIGKGTAFFADRDNQTDLSEIFVAISRDRLGKLFK
ncbi:Hypothetical protein PBC10988_17590 [Planctomycetales bacterium 10988]|nr:Hypothetical protein PBC10988_17590 [Planctomycetales bacterium 10988]